MAHDAVGRGRERDEQAQPPAISLLGANHSCEAEGPATSRAEDRCAEESDVQLACDDIGHAEGNTSKNHIGAMVVS
jgi:hypothetical protein